MALNPNASVYVPGRGMVKNSVLEAERVAAAGSTPKIAPAPVVATPSPAPTPTPAPAKATASETANSKVEDDDDIELTPELLKEMERMKLEDGDDGADFSAVPDIIQDDDRDHLNVIFVGHVGKDRFSHPLDAGKSTISGQVLLKTGQVDKRLLEKYEREAKDKNRESWYLAYILDTNEEERAKGKTVEVGRAYFQTAKKRYTILDAPGHKNYVPNMIGGAAQADVAVLVISARKGEFETGFERGGSTVEHTRLIRTAGVRYLVVAINKMDEPTVNFSKERYDDIVGKLQPFLQQNGFNIKTDVQFLPLSGFSGANIEVPFPSNQIDWFKGPTLLSALDSITLAERDPNAPIRVPIVDKYKDAGTLMVLGKVESGTIRVGDKLLIAPFKHTIDVLALGTDTRKITRAGPGENVRIQIRGIEEENIHPGFVLSSVVDPVPVVTIFEAQINVLELLDHCPLLSAGYECVIHIHCAVEEVRIKALVALVDRKTQKDVERRPKFIKKGQVARVGIETQRPIPLETFARFQQLGRFTLRDAGVTIAIGKVVAVAPKNPDKVKKNA